MTFAMTAAAGSKIEGTSALKDFQPGGTTDKKAHKHQQYDLSFAASGKQYTCRTNEKESLKATDFVVGSDVTYEISGNKGKVKSASGKKGMHHYASRGVARAGTSTLKMAPSRRAPRPIRLFCSDTFWNRRRAVAD